MMNSESVKLIQLVFKHVEAGNYNGHIVSQLIAICEAEGMSSDLIQELRDLPGRDAQGDAESWCLAALMRAVEIERDSLKEQLRELEREHTRESC